MQERDNAPSHMELIQLYKQEVRPSRLSQACIIRHRMLEVCNYVCIEPSQQITETFHGVSLDKEGSTQ